VPKNRFAFVNGCRKRNLVVHHEFTDVLTRVTQNFRDILMARSGMQRKPIARYT